ncbi:MAG TPA: TonB-dependent receptor [Parafilimonas sp.]|nr:TonB-dependent receptor [Parafilimonas sp.]
MRSNLKIILGFLCCMVARIAHGQVTDSLKTLDTVTVSGAKNVYINIAPVQQLDRSTLQQLNSFSVGDAAKYFSGVLIKDYGGVGGLKTISVRSLGAQQTGVLYDGIAMADAQSGQVDLSKLSVTFLQSINLYDGAFFTALMPARSYSYAALLSASTVANFPSLQKLDWRFGLRQGSFGLWQPYAGFTLPASKRTFINFTAEGTKAEGDYPFNINNGSYSEKSKRNNSDIKSLHAEINITTLFNDSSAWKTKAAVYIAQRGLPGAIIFFNDHSTQRLWNTDAFIQSAYNKKFNAKISLLAAAKYTHSYTRYLDPDFLNNQGELDDKYNQDEAYASAALAYNITSSLQFNYASDAAYTTLHSNKKMFAEPSRLSLWNVAGIQYNKQLFHANANVLYTHIHGDVKQGTAADDKNEFTPALAVSIKPGLKSPLLLRAFYKRIFRLPTFNDLYYNIVGNTDLKPEYANQYNVGVTYTKHVSEHLNNISFSVDGYYNTVNDKIIAIPSKNLFIWSVLNLGKVHITGVDVNAEASGKFSGNWSWFIKLAYTWQHAVDVTDKSSASYKDQIPYTPVHSGSGIIQLAYKTWNFSYSNIYSGGRYTLGDNIPANHLNGWITQDISLSKAFLLKHATLTIKGELNNITDQHYDVIKYFPMPGRSYEISISINKK